ncbi:MAG: response regulator transcription factor [Chloroflexi bacterium]|nr:response regulator transcription factor [Chloroflexota bacterium]
MAVLLLIDDDRGLLQLLAEFLSRQGYGIYTADGGRQGLRALYTHQPDLIVLDVSMPEKDGWETLKAIRDLSNVPVIMLTARTDEADVLRGFSLGADDYVSKPFSFAQLLARIHAVLARSAHGAPEDGKLVAGDLEVILSQKRVTCAGALIPLTPTEFKLLVALMQRAGEVLTPEELVREVWGPQYANEIGYVRRYIWHLRQKLETDLDHPRYIHNDRGFGYRFAVAENP